VNHREHQQRDPARPQNATKLGQRLSIVFDMFQNVGADRHIYGVLRKRNVFDVDRDVGHAGAKIGRYVFARLRSNEPADGELRREVQDITIL
jgi:hypothetical protein